MYFSNCSRLCSTSAGVREKSFFGGNAGSTLAPYSFRSYVEKEKIHVNGEVAIETRQVLSSPLQVVI